ncbi:MAG: DUF4410 domain-containing protein [Desulfovibrionales bacterium]
MGTKTLRFMLVSVAVLALMLGGCRKQPTASSPTNGLPAGEVPQLADYPDQGLNLKQYINGMEKAGHNVVMWKDPSVDTSALADRPIYVDEIDARFVPKIDGYPHTPYSTMVKSTLRDTIKASKQKKPNAILVKGSLVEVNYGSKAARFLVGLGAGKASGGVVIEAFLPGKSKPFLRLYGRETASGGLFGGDSVALMNHIFTRNALQVGGVIDSAI